MALVEQISPLRGSQRIESTASRERARSIDPQAPGKSTTILVHKRLWSQKQNNSIRYGMSYVSNTCVSGQQKRMYNGLSAVFSSITSAPCGHSRLRHPCLSGPFGGGRTGGGLHAPCRVAGSDLP